MQVGEEQSLFYPLYPCIIDSQLAACPSTNRSPPSLSQVPRTSMDDRRSFEGPTRSQGRQSAAGVPSSSLEAVPEVAPIVPKGPSAAATPSTRGALGLDIGFWALMKRREVWAICVAQV